MRIWHFSDSHNNHLQLDIPKNIDMAIFSGDASCYKNPAINESEMYEFLNWYKNLDIKYKIFVAGNHDTSIEHKLFDVKNFEDSGIIYLFNNTVEIEGIKIWGSPYTPAYGNWSFMIKRGKLLPLWDSIPHDTDILVTHGPPYGILDMTEGVDVDDECLLVGDKELLNRIKVIFPKYHLFGHIHNIGNILNIGLREIPGIPTKFYNGSVCTDRKMDYITSNGNVFEY